MITVNARLEEYVDMDRAPIVGADVSIDMKMVARFQVFVPRPDDTLPPRSGNGGAQDSAGVIFAAIAQPKLMVGDEILLQSQSGGSGADGTFSASFDVDAAFERLRRTKMNIGGSDESPFDVAAVFAIRVNYAGIEQSLTSEPLSHPVNASVPISADLSPRLFFDFAKVIVGHTTTDSAVLWLCYNGEQPDRAGHRYVCELDEMPSGTRVTSEPVVFDARRLRHTSLLQFRNLKPATDYRYRLFWEDTSADAASVSAAASTIAGDDLFATAAQSAAAQVLAQGTFRTAPPDNSGRISLAFGSCHTPTTPDSLERWQELATRRDYDLMLLIGDQIYEYGLQGGSQQDWFDAYAKRYHQYWMYRPMREVLRRTPTYMTLDDHEIMDDWGSPSQLGDATTSAVRTQANAAIEAYRVFQDSHNPGGADRSPNGPFCYHFRWGPATFFVMDSRTQRGVEVFDDPSRSFPILGEEQFRQMQQWARAPETEEADIVFLVSPVPLALLSVAELENLYKAYRQALETVAGLVGSLAAGPVAAGAGYFVGKELAEEILDREINEDDIRTKADINDQWTEKRNLPDLVRVLDLLFDLANNPRPRTVFVLSGDSHVGAMHVIASAKPEHAANASILQLLSSPISRHSPAERLFGRYADAIPSTAAVNEVVTSLIEDKLGVAPDSSATLRISAQLRKIGVRFTLDTPGAGDYTAQLLGLRPERSFGRVGVERVRSDRRVYRFNLNIHGKLRSLRYDMEVDLDNSVVEPKGVPPNDTVTNLPSLLSPAGAFIKDVPTFTVV